MTELPEERAAAALRRVADLGQRRRDLQLQLNAATEELRDAARDAYAAGADSSRIRALGGIARATLYAWIPADQRRRKGS